MNRKYIYVIILIVGLLIGGSVVRIYYNKMVLENRLVSQIMMAKVDKQVLKLLNEDNIDDAKTLLSEKLDLEIIQIETEWIIRGDSMYNELLY